MGCISSETHHHIYMIRLWNKFINMDESRITPKKDIMYYAVLNQIYDNKNIYSIDAAKCIFANLRNADWKNSLLIKPKL